MFELTYRYDRIFMAFAAVAILTSAVNYSVIAQDKTKERDNSTYRVRFALANIPILETRKQAESNYKLNIDNQQASFSISKENLLVSLFNGDKTSKFLPLIANPETSQIAFNPTPLAPPAPDKKQWDDQVKRRYKNGLIKSVAPGIKHISIKRMTNSGPITINIVEINKSINYNISIEPTLAGNNLNGKAKVINMVRKNEAIVGINASFFKQTTGTPLGTMMINQELITGPIYNRVALGIGDNEFKMARVSLVGQIIAPNGSEIKIDNVNQPRMLSSYTIIYSDKWGKKAPLSPKYGTQVAVLNNLVTNISTTALEIPKDGYVIVGPAKGIGKLNVGDKVQIKFSTNPDWTGLKHIVSGGPYLVKDGISYVDTNEEKFNSITGRNPRTAIGYTKDNRFIMVAIDGRIKKSAGVTLWELSKIMKEFGCYNAMNLDGGSSTQMIIKDKIVNTPLNTGGAYVSNGLIVRLTGSNETEISQNAQ